MNNWLLRTAGVIALLALLLPGNTFAQALSPEEAQELGISLASPTSSFPSEASGRGLRDLSEGVLMVAHEGSRRVILLDAETGDLVNNNFFPYTHPGGGAVKHAILDFNGEGVFLSAQAASAVYHYDLDGNYLGLFAPAGGVNTEIMQNIRGMRIDPTGTKLWVTVAGGPNAGSVVEFDMEGNYLGTFIGPDDSPITQPWDIIVREDDILISSSSPNGIHQFTLDGEYVGQWNEEITINLPQQIHQNAEGHIIAAVFSNPAGVFEFEPDGALVGTYGVVGNLQGVHELPNGNFIVANINGVREINRKNELIRVIISGAANYITPILPSGGLSFNPANLDFEIDEGEIGNQIITLTNTSDSTISFSVSGVDPSIADLLSSISPNTGSIPAGESMDLDLSIDASETQGGLYTGFIHFETDEATVNTYSYFVSIQVYGLPVCTVPESLSFGGIIVENTLISSVEIQNNGTGICTITDASTDHADFEALLDEPLQIAPGNTGSFNVAFTPSTVGVITSTLTITSTDGDLTIELEGEGYEPPSMTFNPEGSLEATVDAGEVFTASFTITNESSGTVTYSFPQFAETRDEMMPANPFAGRQFTIDGGSDGGELIPAWMPTRGQGGPDAFGYTWIDSDEPDGPVFENINIASTSTPHTLVTAPGCNSPANNEGYVVIDLPFGFSFYGEQYSQIWVSANGFIAFQAITGCTFNVGQLPSPTSPTAASPGAMIAPVWADFYGNQATSGIHSQHLLDGRFVIQWTNWMRFNQFAPNTFQVILSPVGTIKFQYLDIQGSFNIGTRVGQQNHTMDDGLLIASGDNPLYPQSGKAVFIIPTPPFITGVSPITGTLAPGASQEVAITIDATDLVDGEYQGSLIIDTDEAGGTTYGYPISVTVIGEAGCVIEPDPIVFEPLIVNFEATQEATITNQGTASCELASASSSHDAYLVDFNPVTLQPGDSATFSVTFAPTSVGTANGTLTLSSPEGDVTAALTGVSLAPPIASVGPEALTFDMKADEIASQTLTLSNLGGSDAANLEYSVVTISGQSEARYIEHAASGTRSTEVLNLTEPAFMLSNGSILNSSWIEYQGPTFAYLRGDNSVTLTQNTSLNINDEAGIACSIPGIYTFQNSYWRVFDLAEYNEINREFTITSVSFGVESVSASIDSWIVLYRLTGSTLTFDTIEELSSTHFMLEGDTSLELVTIDIPETVIGANEALVVEWRIADGSPTFTQVFPGVNNAGESGPTYISTNGCDMSGIVTMASIGYPHVHWVLTVTGESGPPIIGVNPAEGSVSPEGSVDLTVTANTEGLEAGVYEFEVLITTNDQSNPVLTVPVTISITSSMDGEGTPLTFELHPNYPNPFTGVTTIVFDLPQTEHVTIEVIDLTGRRVAVLVDERLDSDRHTVTWNANGLASGVYLYRMQAGSFTKTLRTTLVR